MWPNYVFTGDLRDEGHAFQPQITWPDLYVVVDPTTHLDDVTDKYLQTLRAARSGVVVLREGTPGSADALTFHVPADRRDGNGVVSVGGGPQAGTYGLFSLENNIQAAFNWAERLGMDTNEAQRRQIYTEIAVALGADLLITDNPFALRRSGHRSTLATMPTNALAVIGLHQRLRGHIVLTDALVGGTLRAEFAEHSQAWSMLTGLHDLFDMIHSSSETLDLVRACGARLKRVLYLRDRLLAGSIHPSTINFFAEPPVLVEQIALNLSGMFDSLARAINVALNLRKLPNHCSLTDTRFSGLLPADARAILNVPLNKDVLNLVAAVRNTIHHLDLSGGGEGDSRGGTAAQLVGVDTGTATKVRIAAITLDRESVWIAHDLPGFDLMIHPVPVVEDLIETCVAIVQQLTYAIPWPGADKELLPDRDKDPSDWSRYPPTLEIISRLYGLNSSVNPRTGVQSKT